MKVSGFTFLRNAQKLGYPFAESLRSILPIVDEFVIALGPSDDATEEMIQQIADPKIRVIHTQWNERIRNDLKVKGFVYGQQKSIALFNCTGDWAFYLEGDEVVHEDDLPKIQEAMRRHLDNLEVEALYFDYIHFQGNQNTYVWDPGTYRTAPRILRNTIPAWGPKGLFFIILDTAKKGRYPKAASANARIFHYGYLRSNEQMALKNATVYKYWSNTPPPPFDYGEIDPYTLKLFTGTHPKVMAQWLPPAEGIFKANPSHKLTFDEIRHRIMLKIESWTGAEFSHKHYTRVA
jgi:glycosyltransferase involved in cell wall biosynthesis